MALIMSNSHFGTVVYLFIELWHSLSKIPTREGVIHTHNLWSENRELIGQHRQPPLNRFSKGIHICLCSYNDDYTHVSFK